MDATAGTPDAPPPPQPDPWRAWKRFGLFLGAGLAAVFLYEIVDLVRHLLSAREPADRGAAWSILFMIAGIFGGVGVIAVGLARAIRRESPRRGGGREGRGGAGHP